MIRRGTYDASEAFNAAWDQRARSTATNAEVRDLVHSAEILTSSAAAQPSTQFKTSLRDQLMAEAATVLSPVATKTRSQPHRTRSVRHHDAPPARRRFAAFAAAMVAGVAVVGTTVSSASAVPGDVLYPVKRGVENVQLAFHRDDASRGEYQLQQARERLAEASYLVQERDGAELTAALDDFVTQAAGGTDDLFEAYTADQAPQNIDTVNDFVASASVTLAELSPDVPTDAADSFAAATDLIGGAASEASALCGSCAPADIGSIVKSIEDFVAGGTTDPIPAPTPEAGKAPAVENPSAKPVTPLPSAQAPHEPGSDPEGADPPRRDAAAAHDPRRARCLARRGRADPRLARRSAGHRLVRFSSWTELRQFGLPWQPKMRELGTSVTYLSVRRTRSRDRREVGTGSAESSRAPGRSR